jgi:shikimate dehydrogenase
VVAAVVGAPVGHSLSPLIHNAWLAALGLDGVYVALRPGLGEFAGLARALRGGVIRGLNVTAPYKLDALAAADRPTARAARAGSANLLVFETSGEIVADNTDGEGLLDAFARASPGFDPRAGPVVILGAGGAARGAVAALLDAGAPSVRLVNRSPERAQALARAFAGAVTAVPPRDVRDALAGAAAIINATPAAPDVPLEAAPASAVVMDMVYRPLMTPLLARARSRHLVTVDGLAMLIGQARPSFSALFGVPAPDIDVRALALAALEEQAP